MIRGCQREMIVLQTKESPLFESAYFVLRRGHHAPRGDMLAESNRIIDGGREYLQKKRKWHGLLPFFAGLLAGGVLTLAIVGIILL